MIMSRKINFFLEESIEYAQEKCYLDDLFSVYPTKVNALRDIDGDIWDKVEKAYKSNDDKALIDNLLNLELFPIKNSYVAYLKHDRSAIQRNPKTVKRIARELHKMDINDIFEKCSQPKEANRQIGPMFKNWVSSGALRYPVVDLEEFSNGKGDAILDASDKEMEDYARTHLGYNHKKGLDFLARISDKYVIGEAKFLSDFGGHQNTQFNDAISTVESDVKKNVIKVAILDGVLYIPSKNKLYKAITEEYYNYNIMSALVLGDFLDTIR